VVREADETLLERVAARDRSAGAELFDRYAGEIFGLLARATRPSDAEDLLQEVFVRALRRSSSFRGDASVRTWLHGIARLTLLERYRARREAASLGDLPAPGPGPESFAIGAQQCRERIAQLERLPDHEAIVLELHRIDGLSHDEIAALLGISPAASRKRLQRAVATLDQFQTGDSVEPEAGLARHSRFETWRASLLRRVIAKEEPHVDTTRREPSRGHP